MASVIRGARITLHLPVNDTAERRAATSVISEVTRRHQGATHSLLQPSAFRGYWVSDGAVIIDGDQEPDDPALLAGLDTLRMYTFEACQAAGSPQDEVWMIVHATSRVAGV